MLARTFLDQGSRMRMKKKNQGSVSQKAIAVTRATVSSCSRIQICVNEELPMEMCCDHRANRCGNHHNWDTHGEKPPCLKYVSLIFFWELITGFFLGLNGSGLSIISHFLKHLSYIGTKIVTGLCADPVGRHRLAPVEA